MLRMDGPWHLGQQVEVADDPRQVADSGVPNSFGRFSEPDDDTEDGDAASSKRKPKPMTRSVYGQSRAFPEHFANREGFTPALRIPYEYMGVSRTFGFSSSIPPRILTRTHVLV